ncbi:MAG: PEP/pyruvate-binding domain-containing protein [Phycisphaeraceae bacterium]
MIAERFIFEAEAADDASQVGAKAANLARLHAAGLAVPPFVVVTDASPETIAQLQPCLARLTQHGRPLAVRSSSIEEDREASSFAGLLSSVLHVAPVDVRAAIEKVQQAVQQPRVEAYRRDRGLAGEAPTPAVIVQTMLDPDVSGVAFGADPVSGEVDVCVISAVAGCAEALVDGAVDGQTWRVDNAGCIVNRTIASGDELLLSDEQLIAISELTRRAGELFGRPQDVEWAIKAGKLWVVQSRPITTLPSPQRDQGGVRRVWDNANISESYGGITTPLTYSFARSAYEGVYRAFCQLMGVPDERVRANDDMFGRMLGLFRGRVYYNLFNWYRLIAMLPGYASNRRFMEQMMGVREPMPDEVLSNVAPVGWRGRWRDRLQLVRSVGTLLFRYVTLGGATRRFNARVDAALAPGPEAIQSMSLDALAGEYRRLERSLLSRWDAPLVNDFFTMICFGLLRRCIQRWGGDAAWGHVGQLLSGDTGMVSAEPVRQIESMGRLAANIEGAATMLLEADRAQVNPMLDREPALRNAVATYLDRFGDRCMDELKLEAATLHEDSTPLWRAIGQAAMCQRDVRESDAQRPNCRADAQRALDQAIGRRPVRRLVLRMLVRFARMHLTMRENLRFQRTRVFGRVRRIVLRMGERLHAAGQLDRADDVFYLNLDELFSFVEGGATCTNLSSLASMRRAEFEAYAQQPAPPERFETRGAAHLHPALSAVVSQATESNRSSCDHGHPADGASILQGTGCHPGRVRGVVRRVVDARRAAPAPGQILVAERTDPGWVTLFPGAAGVLVQRGSVLSHAATLAREMGIPTIVSLAGLMDAIHDGDLVEMDGEAGTVRVVEPAASRAASR